MTGCALWLLALGLAALVTVWDVRSARKRKTKEPEKTERVGCVFGSSWEVDDQWQEEAEDMDQDHDGA